MNKVEENKDKLGVILNRGSEEMKRFGDQLTIKADKLEEYSKRCVEYGIDDARSCTEDYEYNLKLRHELMKSLKLFIKSYVEFTGNNYIYFGEFLHMAALRTQYSKSYIQLGLVLLTKDSEIYVEYPTVDDINLIKFRPTSYFKMTFSKDDDFFEPDPDSVIEDDLIAYKEGRCFTSYADVFISDPDRTLNHNRIRNILEKRDELISELNHNCNYEI